MQINSLTICQLVRLQKLSLLRLTGIMEKCLPVNKSGWNWMVPRFMKRHKVSLKKIKTINQGMCIVQKIPCAHWNNNFKELTGCSISILVHATEPESGCILWLLTLHRAMAGLTDEIKLYTWLRTLHFFDSFWIIFYSITPYVSCQDSQWMFVVKVSHNSQPSWSFATFTKTITTIGSMK